MRVKILYGIALWYGMLLLFFDVRCRPMKQLKLLFIAVLILLPFSSAQAGMDVRCVTMHHTYIYKSNANEIHYEHINTSLVGVVPVTKVVKGWVFAERKIGSIVTKFAFTQEKLLRATLINGKLREVFDEKCLN